MSFYWKVLGHQVVLWGLSCLTVSTLEPCSGELRQNKILVKPMKNSKISKLLAKKNMSHWFGGEVTDGKTSFEVLFGFYTAPARLSLSK